MNVKNLGIPIYPTPVPHVLFEDLKLALGSKKFDDVMRKIGNAGITEEIVADGLTLTQLERV